MGTQLRNKIAVITGGSTGIGLARPRPSPPQGPSSTSPAGARPNWTPPWPPSAPTPWRAGGFDPVDDLDRLYALVAARHGRIDVLYANAGGGDMLPLGAITEAHVDDTLAVTSRGWSSRCKRRCLCWTRRPTVPRSSWPAPPPAAWAPPTSASTARPKPRAQPGTQLGAGPEGPRHPHQHAVARPHTHARPGGTSPARMPRSSRACWTTWRARCRWAAWASGGHRQGRRLPGFGRFAFITGIELFVDGGMAQV